MDVIQNFVFVKGCSALLIDMFKDKNFELNKKEIHSELLYRRIFEIERFESAINFFVNKLASERDHNYLFILRKMCVIDGNPLPLVQDKIVDVLYKEEGTFPIRYIIKSNDDNDVYVLIQNEGEKSKEISIIEFFETSKSQEQNFLLEQLTLEADLCYGRNITSKQYFREIYPCDWLIQQIKNNKINKELRGKFIRLINYIYIDDPPHKLLKMARAFKAYESSKEYIEKISSTRSEYLDNKNLNELIKYVNLYIEAFCCEATGTSYFRSFDMEFVRMLNYLLKFGLFIYRDNAFQMNDIDLVFSYLCHLCDIFTSRSYIKSVYSLDKIISRDTIISDLSNLNPVQRSAYDIKYTLFNSSYSDMETKRNEYKNFYSKSDTKFFHTKILTEIISIFHLFNDLRQHYLMSNNVEFFYKKIYKRFRTADNKLHTEDQLAEMNKILLKEFLHVIPDAPEFHNHMQYELPSIDLMYENNELDKFDIALTKTDSNISEMHEEYVTLMIDTFNLHSYDPFLRQLIILLICRYHSERAEFMRNLDRTILFFDDSDWRFYLWTLQQLEKFVFYSEKSNIWLLKIKNMIVTLDFDLDVIDKLDVNNELLQLMDILNNLKKAVVYNCIIRTNDDGNLELEVEKGERKINIYSQNLFRNVKVYDYLIDFLFQNKILLLKVRQIELNNVSESKKDIVMKIRKVFKRIFRILEVMTINNNKTQELMWKYKEDFIFEELGGSEQEGELELVLAIIDDSETAVKFNQNKYTLSKTRRFVNLLNKRVKGHENFVLLLEIYNKLIKFEAISFLKQSLVKLILQNPVDIYTHDKSTRNEFEKSLNIQEIVYSVIYNEDMIFVREFLKDLFPLERFFELIESSIQKLDELESNDKLYDAQYYDELREYQYIALMNIFTQLYLNANHSDTDREELLSNFKNYIAKEYIRKLNKFNSDTDFNDATTFKKSKMLFLLDYMQIFFKGIRRYVENTQEGRIKEGNTRRSSLKEPTILDENSQYHGDNLGIFAGIKRNIEDIEHAYNEVIARLDDCDNEDIYQIIANIHDEIEYGEIRTSNLSSRRNIRSLQASKSMRIQRNATNSSKMSNLRSTESANFSMVWKKYVETITTSRDSRRLIDEEHLALAKLMFDTLIDRNSNPLLVQSFKTFISTSIDYVYVCEKANWTLYIVVFIFKLNSMILNLSNQKTIETDAPHILNKIDSNILDSLDTLRTSSMIFKILSTSKDDIFTYSNEIFGVASYFCTKLLMMRTRSVQEKFLGFFKNDSTSQHFFKQCNEYIQVHMEKLHKGSLKAFYSQQRYTDELSKTCYLVDKNLEKQIVNMLSLL